MIKFGHSIFALPFAMIGMMWGSKSNSGSIWPGWQTLGWIVLAMVSCRSAAMAFNRIADRDIDSLNPRTKVRAIPAGLLKVGQVQGFLWGSIALFLFASYQLNPLSLWLSPVAILFTLGYSMTKRFTWLCHVVLGFSLGIAPAAAWIAVTGSFAWPIGMLTLAVTFWTAGFDVIYALQDEEFDREHNLKSIPQRFGKSKALTISRVFHVLCVGCLIGAGVWMQVGTFYFIGAGLAAILLVYEQSLVKPTDLSKVDLAFFTLNGYVSVAVFAFAWIDCLVRSR